MALIDCYECNKQISSSAPSCPHCGAPANGAATQPVAPKKQGVGPFRRMLITMFWGIAGLFILASIFGDKEGTSSTTPNDVSNYVAREAADTKAKREAEARAQALENIPAISAGQLAKAYEENTVAADQIFKGKQFKVSGVVSSINTDIFGDPYVVLRAGVNQFMEPHFGFGKEYANRIAELRKGMKVTLLCTGRGDVAKTPMAKDCQIQ